VSDIPITITSQEVGSEAVAAGFQRMGAASDQMSCGCSRIIGL
jgi:hypothetical protein